MATREQLAIILDSARGWTVCADVCYDTNHLFYAFQVYYVTAQFTTADRIPSQSTDFKAG